MAAWPPSQWWQGCSGLYGSMGAVGRVRFSAAGVMDFRRLFRGIWQRSRRSADADPIADKLLVATNLMALVADRTVASWTIQVIILCRVLVSGLREHLAELKVRLPVSAIAKWKTAAQLVALGFLIAGPAGEVVLSGTVKIGAALLWAAAILTLYTGFDYLQSAWNHFGEDEAT
jgi:CDP-diacylglycerol--glycerol-3-phosphate 3-phosphatidyltransferase/cardiolipin synthase